MKRITPQMRDGVRMPGSIGIDESATMTAEAIRIRPHSGM